MARAHLTSLLDPEKKQLEEHEIEGILMHDTAILNAINGDYHNLTDNINSLVSLIDTHRKTQDNNMEQTFSKMQEALSAKKQLSDDISNFEAKQSTIINCTLLVIVGILVSFCVCWIRYKKPAANKDTAPVQEPQYEIAGTAEEQERKMAAMRKLVDTLVLMDEEIVKMEEELAKLKKR